MSTQEKLKQLRTSLIQHKADGFLVPRHDLFQGEYIAPHDERLAWVSGFTGSAGLALITLTDALLFTDGRYTLQASHEVDTNFFTIHNSGEFNFTEWLKESEEKPQVILYDPWLHTPAQVEYWQHFCPSHIQLKASSHNFIDALWIKDRPSLEVHPIRAHSLKYAGVSTAEKCKQLIELMKKQNVDRLLITAPESVCWLLNIRGQDVPFTPVVHSFAILHQNGSIDLIVRSASVEQSVFENIPVKIYSFDHIPQVIENVSSKKVWIDNQSIPMHLVDLLKTNQCNLLSKEDPCALPRAAKNSVEQEGTRNAHKKDGLAVIKFWHWLEITLDNEPITELDAVSKLEEFRKEQDLFQYPSFATISGSGPNGAIIHYRVTPKTNRTLQKGDIYLIDSGGQYFDGTTDITRTLTLNPLALNPLALNPKEVSPSAEQKKRYTLVLQGHIALAQAHFPHGTTGSALDTLARIPLWQEGLDFDHGTGHGVGSFMNVHEGPQRISKAPNTIALLPGMIISNEPGYYKPGAYGIRIENLVLVVNKPARDERPILGFETLTLVPFDKNLIDLSILNPKEIKWINDYHQRIYETYQDQIDPLLKTWLREKTSELD